MPLFGKTPTRIMALGLKNKSNIYRNGFKTTLTQLSSLLLKIS